MDFRTVVGNQSFGVRATGLVVQDEKLYLVKSPKEKSYHQLELLYIVTPLSNLATNLEEGDSVRQCEWIAFTDLKNLDLNPAFLKTELAGWKGQLQHFVNKDN